MMAVCPQALSKAISPLYPSYSRNPHPFPFVIIRFSTAHAHYSYVYTRTTPHFLRIPCRRRERGTRSTTTALVPDKTPPVRPMSCMPQHPPVTIADCHATIALIPDTVQPLNAILTHPIDNHPYFQLRDTTGDILIPAAFHPGGCLVPVNEAMPLPEGWTLSSPRLASTKYTPVWPTARKLAETVMQKCPTIVNGHETTSLGWALTESWIEDYR